MQDGIVELWMTSRGFERKGEAAADDIIKDNTDRSCVHEGRKSSQTAQVDARDQQLQQ